MYPDKDKENNPTPVRDKALSGDDLEMIQELDYEEKKRNKPYDQTKDIGTKHKGEQTWIKILIDLLD